MDPYKQLPPDIEANQQTIQGPQEECQRLDAASVAPIHKCPHELLVMIFKHYLSNKPFLIRCLLLVCKTWHAIAVSTPLFWTKIFINMDTNEVDAEDVIKALRPRIEASLLHSQTLLLDIRLDLQGLFPGDALWKPSHILRFFQSFVGRHGINMVRWKSLDVIFPYVPDMGLCTSILGLFVGPTPHLTTLSLSVRKLHLQLSNPIFPDLSSLKSLDIDSVELLDRISVPFSSLENLSMACSYAVEFQIARLHRFTSLTALTMRPGLGYYENDSVSTTVALPLLKEIRFRLAVPSRRVQFDLPLLSNLHFELLHPSFSMELPIMSPRSVSLRDSGRSALITSEALIRQYGSMETLSVSECMEADLKIIVEDLRREGSLSRTFNLVRVVSDENQETELRVWRI